MSEKKSKNIFSRKISKDIIKKDEIIREASKYLGNSETLIHVESCAGNFKIKDKKEMRKLSAHSDTFTKKIKKNKLKARNSMVEQLNGTFYDVSCGRVIGKLNSLFSTKKSYLSLDYSQ